MTANSFTNHELNLAYDYVNFTDSHVFLTGKAGTGKTTFLHDLKKNTAKRLIITAPTGVAAINAGGVTIHSFFQLPLGPFVPGCQIQDPNRSNIYRFSKEKKEVIRNLDLLVIDEISMVRADLLDAVDTVLQSHRHSNEPFGGVQLLMIGDLHQLSPVAKPDEWDLLRQHYDSVYFFSSHALSQANLVIIELKHIYRQADIRFIDLLNKIRDNQLNPKAIQELNQRYIPNFKPNEDDAYIYLTTHNAKADAINQSKLTALKEKEKSYHAEIKGEFQDYQYPAPDRLHLKVGAQVMFLRNDSSPDKRFFNGKIGKIQKLSNEYISVICPDESGEIIVEPVEWENIKYTINPETKEIESQVIGKFKQYPLKLAWAITIHKSQGLTFEKAVIDAQSAFAYGQVYVALSRLRSFDGLVLSSPIPLNVLQTDETVLRFCHGISRNSASETRLLSDKIAYQQKLILNCFDLEKLHHLMNYFSQLLRKHSRVIRVSGIEDISRVRQIFDDMYRVSENFKRQLTEIFPSNTMPADDPYVLERIQKGSVWFQNQFALIQNDLFHRLHIETDNQDIQKSIRDTLKNIKKEMVIHMAGFKSCETGFSSIRYLRAISSVEQDVDTKGIENRTDTENTLSDVEHPELLKKLKQWRDRKAEEQGITKAQIIHQQILIQIAILLPKSISELRKIKGFGKKTSAKYGKEILDIITSYCNTKGGHKVSNHKRV